MQSATKLSDSIHRVDGKQACPSVSDTGIQSYKGAFVVNGKQVEVSEEGNTPSRPSWTHTSPTQASKLTKPQEALKACG